MGDVYVNILLLLGDEVYVQVRVNTDDVNVKMRVDTCYAKPDPNAGQSMTYTLIDNGCVRVVYIPLRIS